MQPSFAPSDSQEEKLSEEALDKSAENPELNEDGGAGTEASGSACPEDSLALAESPDSDLPKDKVGANGHDASKAENGAIQMMGADHEGYGDLEETHAEGEEESDEDAAETLDTWAEGGVTIGAKRASVGVGLGTQELDWILDSPEGLAPSKRGRTQPEHPLAVMRHSVRLDDAIHERQRKLGAMATGSGSESSENGEGDELAAIPWPDRALRPYDSPIVDTDLPARQAKELSRLGMGSETLILCSPFRRCLQTAGVVARTLGVGSVTVHLEVGERMDKVRKEIAELALVNEQESDGALGNKPTPVFSYLGEEAMCEALGAGVELERIVGEQPPQEESGVEAKQRFIATIAKVREEKLRESPVLVVAHGDTLDAAGESLASQIVFEGETLLRFCCRIRQLLFCPQGCQEMRCRTYWPEGRFFTNEREPTCPVAEPRTARGGLFKISNSNVVAGQRSFDTLHQTIPLDRYPLVILTRPMWRLGSAYEQSF